MRPRLAPGGRLLRLLAEVGDRGRHEVLQAVPRAGRDQGPFRPLGHRVGIRQLPLRGHDLRPDEAAGEGEGAGGHDLREGDQEAAEGQEGARRRGMAAGQGQPVDRGFA